MLFNSAGFLFAFLPAALILHHFVFARTALRQPFLILATLAFYALGSIRYVPLLLFSVAINYAAARVIGGAAGARLKRAALVLGIGLDLALLFYFKYMNFFLSSADGLLGAHLALLKIVLPLGISFYTFQQIGFLVDLARGRFRMERGVDFVSFMLFFPHLVAGPIVRYEEVVPQLRRVPEHRDAAGNVLVGLTIFAIGLCKKAVVADSIATLAGPVFDAAAKGHAPTALAGWVAGFAYTAQIYFDFSGYSDMAIGVARMFGIVLPLNFHSPLRATGIVELWRRWHVTLSRWVQSYVFQPLSMPFARFAADHTPGRTGMFLISFALPTMLSMIVIGIWHGAGWTFVVFGVMQGIYMAVNEYWTLSRRKLRRARKGPPPAYVVPLSRALTIFAFVVSEVAFRAPDLASLGRMYLGMIGRSGSTAAADPAWPGGGIGAIVAVVLVYAIVLLAPNTQQIVGRYAPVLEWTRWRKVDPPRHPVEWRMTVGWTVVSTLLLFAGFVLMMRGTTNFIYFNF